MMDRAANRVNFSREDFAVVAEAVMARFPLRAGEARRLAKMRELLAQSQELNRLLAAHTHRALVHCQGTHGIGDIAADSNSLFDALAGYGVLIRDIADTYRALGLDMDVEMRRDVGRETTRERHAEISAQ
jgi:hypothetical protein